MKSKFLKIFILSPIVYFTEYAFCQTTHYNLADVVSISAISTEMNESWPSTATIVIRRTGGIKALTIPLAISGTATLGLDYLSVAGNSVTIPMGKREVWLQLKPIPDNLVESTETVRFTIQSSSNYVISGSTFAEVNLLDKNPLPSNEEATRFLIQAGFGADPDELADVKSMGFEAWIDAQIARPKGFLQPVWVAQNILAYAGPPETVYEREYNTRTTLWHQVMRRRYPPSGGTVATDILRQRIAYSLLQIYVVAQTGDDLAVNPEGVLNYYDKLVDAALGNFRDLLYNVSIHPCMGLYLSHIGNKKADPANNTFPDENYAREIMQLFSIGLWELNQDGTRKVDANGNNIPTYTNADISQFARVFTGLDWGGTTWHEFRTNMVANEANHDLAAKNLLGTAIPAGQSTFQDVNSAIDVLFNHPNTGPFIARLLIQRLVTSNPSPAYIGRVAAKFANNGLNIRGDMAAVVKQILLDPEARDFAKTKEPTFGKMREPYLTMLNFAKTFNAQPPSGDYHEANQFYDFYLQEPFLSPSVFNFYSPNFRPPGLMTQLAKFAPEFQILTAVTALEASNFLYNAQKYSISRWGTYHPANEMKFNYTTEIPLAGTPDALLKQLAIKLLGGTIRPRSFQLIKELLLQMPSTGADWQKNRIDTAVYMMGMLAEFNVLK
jgi:uncharacterized protein (DUF1800 family)